jgi:hypothetical protein
MMQLNVSIEGSIAVRLAADMQRSRRGPTAEANYVIEKGLALIEAELARVEGKSPVELVAEARG